MLTDNKQKRKVSKKSPNQSQMDAILAPDRVISQPEVDEKAVEQVTFAQQNEIIERDMELSPGSKTANEIINENDKLIEEISPRSEADVELPQPDFTVNERVPSRNKSAISFSRMSISSQTFQQTEQQFKQFVVSKFYDLIKVIS